MIKYYKRPFSRTLSFSTVAGLLIFIISLVVFCKYILLPCLLTGDWATWVASGIVSLFMVALWYSYIGMYFYIILYDDKITVRNHFLPFFRISRNYNDIGSIRFWLPVPGNWSVEAVEIANQSIYGLSGSIITRDMNKAIKVSEQMECGGFVVNGASFFRSFEQPFFLPCFYMNFYFYC